MQETWRWFGPADTVTPQQIRQAGASGVVTALDHINTGEVWSLEEIKARQSLLTQNGLEWTVVESVPVHQDIKLRTGHYKTYINNYRQSLVNLGRLGIKRVCYNFMPVVDWTRTNLSFELENASSALRFEMSDFIAYDVHILERPGAVSDYSQAQVDTAAQRYSAMSEEEVMHLESNIIAGLPGGEGSYDRQGIKEAIDAFQDIGTTGLQRNLQLFLSDIIPVAEQAGVVLAIHPDDPPFSLFGLPRVVSTAQDASPAILLAGRRLHINLIPYNSVSELQFKRPSRERQLAFAEVLRSANLSVTLRRSLGGEEEAACGQLRRRSAPSVRP